MKNKTIILITLLCINIKLVTAQQGFCHEWYVGKVSEYLYAQKFAGFVEAGRLDSLKAYYLSSYNPDTVLLRRECEYMKKYYLPENWLYKPCSCNYTNGDAPPEYSIDFSTEENNSYAQYFLVSLRLKYDGRKVKIYDIIFSVGSRKVESQNDLLSPDLAKAQFLKDNPIPLPPPPPIKH